MSKRRAWPAPWIFSLLILPLGMVVGFNFTPLPFLLAKAGVPVDRVATISSITNLPGVLGLLIAPIADIKLRRRTWLAIGTFGTALAACFYFPLIGASHLILMTVLIFAGGMVTFLVVAACGGLMVKLLSATDQSKAAAWTQVGILGGGALGGAIVLWLITRMSLVAAGLCYAVMIALLGIVPFTISEPAPEPSGWFRGRLTTLGKEIWELSPVAGTRMGYVVAPIALRDRRGAKPAAGDCFALRGRCERRNVDQRHWRKRSASNRGVVRHADSRGLGPTLDLCGRRGYQRTGVCRPDGGQSAVDLPGGHGALLGDAGSLLGTERGAYRGHRRTRSSRRQYALLPAERRSHHTASLHDLA
jgi:hypothetical protein